jgi:hypothetical protein
MHSLPKKAALLGFAACMAVASPSFADRLAALVPQVKPPPPPELRDRFHEAISRGLQGSGVEVLPAAEVRLRLGSSDEMLNCSGVGPCVARSAQALGADRLVAADIGITGKDYTIKLRMLDPVGREVAKVDEPCDICTVKEADEAMTRAAAKLTAAAKSAPPIETAPPAPQPKVETPQPQPPPQPTPPRAEPTPTPPSAQPATTPPAVTTRVERHVPWRALAITSLVVGVAAIGGGAGLVAIDGQPTCGLPNPKQSCPDVYNTVGGGAALLSLGIAGVAASGAMFYLDYRARHKPHPTVMLVPTRDGAYLTASGRF